MNFFDKLGNKITSTSKEVSQKAKDFAETTKLNSSINAEQNKINSLFIDLGKKYYELKSDNPETEYTEIIDRINTAKQTIVNLNQQIDAIKAANAAKTCTFCGAVLNDDAVFCVKCGAKAEVKPVPPEDDFVADVDIVVEQSVKKTCKVCGMTLDNNAVFCTGCGTKVE